MTVKKNREVSQCNGSEESRIRLYIEKRLPFVHKHASQRGTSNGNNDSSFTYSMEKLLERFAGAWRELAKS